MNTNPMIVAMLNQKGGVGKTTNCFHLSGAFSKLGMKTLLVDLDPQANLTQGFWGSQKAKQLDPAKSVVRLFNENLPEPDIDEVIYPTEVEGVSLLAGHGELENYDETRPEERGQQQFALRHFLDEVMRDPNHRPDVVLVDCRPTLNLLGWNALLASNRVMVPFQAEDFGSQGVVRIQEKFDQALTSHNRNLRLLGYCMTMVDGRFAVHKAYQLTLRQMYGDAVFKEIIPRAAAFPESVLARQVIHKYKPRVKAAKAIMAIAEEMISRHEALEGSEPELLAAGKQHYREAV